MTIRKVEIERFSVASSKSFGDVVSRLEPVIGHPDMIAFRKNVAAAQTEAELEKVVHGAIGSSGLMEFIRFDLGEVLRKERGAEAPQSLRLVVGNPLIMKQMVKLVCSITRRSPKPTRSRPSMVSTG